jgi:hypothetical protein
VFELERATTVEEVNALFKAAAEGPLKGILGYEERPLVSTDYTNDTRSSIVDAPSTMVVNGTQLKVYAWYDNEMGYAHRLVDVALMVGPRCERPRASRGPVGLYRRHRGLLGVHADRWRAQDAGPAAFPHAGLLAGAAGLSLRALRDRGRGHEPVGGMDRRALRADATLYAGLGLQVVALAGADAARSGLGIGHVGGLRDAGAGRIGRGQGPVQDVVEIGGEAAGADRGGRAVPLGRAADRIEERGEGAGFPAGRGASGDGGFNVAVLGMAAFWP